MCPSTVARLHGASAQDEGIARGLANRAEILRSPASFLSMCRRLAMAIRAEMEGKNYWSELIALRDEQRARRARAIQVVRGKDLPLERNKHGLMRWYLH